MGAHSVLPTEVNEAALLICDASTNYYANNVAFCDTPERAAAIVRACREYDDLQALVKQIIWLATAGDESKLEIPYQPTQGDWIRLVNQAVAISKAQGV